MIFNGAKSGRTDRQKGIHSICRDLGGAHDRGRCVDASYPGRELCQDDRRGPGGDRSGFVYGGGPARLCYLALGDGAERSALSDYSLPLVGLVFLIGGIGAGLLAGVRGTALWKTLGEGVSGIAPSIPLILMAASVKHIVSRGGIMDTLLHGASTVFVGTGSSATLSPLAAALVVYVLALLIEFFIGSASAKAFLIMPILLPLADLVGVTRQVTVTAYCFGDGFSNMIYPTNPVLLIALGLAAVSYGQWLKWTAKLWLWVVAVSVGFLWLATAIGYGPF